MKCIPGWFLLGACVILGSRLNRGSADFLDREYGSSPFVHRIAGGRAAVENSTPWMVFLHNKEDFVCGGSLISKAFVLTAAHCVFPTPKQLWARLGEYDLGIQKVCRDRFGCNPLDNEYKVRFIYTHPLYKSVQSNDIAILKLEREVRYTAYIRPICLLMKDDIDAWQQYLVGLRHLSMTGWGATEYSSLSRVLQTANLTLIDRTTCRNQHRFKVDETHICAGDPQRYVCTGDSGSPLGLLVHYEGSDHYVQLGIVSNGNLPCRGVAVFTNVLSYADWIASVMAYDERYMLPPRLINKSN